MNIDKISLKATSYLKGIGILMIIFHNYFNHIVPSVGHNEFYFQPNQINNFISQTLNSPSRFFQNFVTYFGHFGVQIFIFCSGYGLAIVYYGKELKFKRFITNRFIKLYPTFTIAIILLLFYQYIILNMDFSYRVIGSIAIRYTLVANLIPGKIFTLSGPYWFYSMIVQLYFCFPFLMKIHKKHKHGLYFIIIITYLIILSTASIFTKINFSLYYNFIGNLPVFIIGIIWATSKQTKPFLIIWLLSILIFIFGQYNAYVWSFTQISMILITIPVLTGFYKQTRNTYLGKTIIKIGELSMYLFAVSGFLRQPWLEITNNPAKKYNQYLYFALYFLITIVVAYVLKSIVKKTLPIFFYLTKTSSFSVDNSSLKP